MDEEKREQIIEDTARYVQDTLAGDSSGHDWWHIYRVWRTARKIASQEGADIFTVELAALLHDIADFKFHDGDDTVGVFVARKWLEEQQVDAVVTNHVLAIIKGLSFKGAGVDTAMHTLEGMIVQDADRLDAIGAIGIGRTFAFGGYKGRLMYDPAVKPAEHSSFEEYKWNTSPTINHFYEKLLLLKDLMNTETARKAAVERHQVMEKFLNRFFKEWEGDDIFPG